MKEKNTKRNEVPKRPLLEEIGNAITHGVGTLLAIWGFIMMLIKSDTPLEVISAVIYFVGLCILFTMSCLYHAFPNKLKVKKLFRRFDYLSIYLLIGATYTPILLLQFGDSFGVWFCVIQWVIIATGITFIGIFGPGKLKWLHFPLYIILGWCGLLFLPDLFSNNFYLFIFILVGGVVYSLGIIPFVMKKNVAHFIWHFFVLFGAIIHFLGIYFYLY